MALRINVGCGQSLIDGWKNYDNSLSIKLAKIPYLPDVLRKIRLIHQYQYDLMCFARNNDVDFVNASQKIPQADNSVDVIYSCHMLEHMDRKDASSYLSEAYRVLKPGGVIRTSVPDFKKLVDSYNESGDANDFLERSLMCLDRPRSFIAKLNLIVAGPRHHQWMYDGKNLCALMTAHGFVDAQTLPPGETTIPSYQPLDLHERAEESVYVEARKPGA